MGVIVFLGDSITDAGRTTSCPPLGAGYVREFASALGERENTWNIFNDKFVISTLSYEL